MALHERLTLERLATALVFVLIGVLACLMSPQNDTWWLLRVGQDIWRTGAVPMVEQYSHTADGRFWMNHEWLSQASFYAAYWTGGLPLLTVLAAGAVTGTLAIVWSLMTGPTLLRLGLITFTVMTFSRTWTPRPYVFTELLLGVCATLLVSKRPRWLPLVFVLWANLHGGFTLGLALVGAWVIAALPDGRSAVFRRLVVLAGCLAATLITPLGFRFYAELPASVARLRLYNIVEWQAPSLANPLLLPFWVLLPVFLVLVAMRWRAILAAPADRFLAVAALVLLPFALSYSRNVGPFLILCLPTIARALRVETRVEPPVLGLLGWVHVGVLVGAVAVGGTVVATAWSGPSPRLRWQPLSRQAMTAVESCAGPLYNGYGDGGYLIWFMPERKVFIDSRQDPYPVDLVLSDMQTRRTGDYAETFARHGIRCALLRASSPILADRLLVDGWLERYRGPTWVVFETGDENR